MDRIEGRRFRITLDRKLHDQDPEEESTFWGNPMSYFLKRLIGDVFFCKT